MAQKTEKEETEFKSLSLCINNCGVTGNPATNNMCQKCFNGSTTTSSTTPPLKFSTKTRRSNSLRSPHRISDPSQINRDLVSPYQNDENTTVLVTKQVNRCSGCRRKVGLTGFRCRCGDLFCAEHRYSDRHDCSYDYKSAGREAIARENPVVKAAKIVRL